MTKRAKTRRVTLRQAVNEISSEMRAMRRTITSLSEVTSRILSNDTGGCPRCERMSREVQRLHTVTTAALEALKAEIAKNGGNGHDPGRPPVSPRRRSEVMPLRAGTCGAHVTVVDG